MGFAMGQLGHPAGYFLTQRQRRGILQMRATDLDDIGKASLLASSVTRSLAMAGSNLCSMAVTAATCMAVG
jgi:hypothetical protein